jgi:hypothetical protein
VRQSGDVESAAKLIQVTLAALHTS